MPVYDYACAGCGPFTALRPMADSALPLGCPDCGSAAPRALLSAPAFAGMEAGRRAAHATNERAAHAPRRVGGAHGPGCGCCAPRAGGRTARAADGAKSFPGARPWMICH